MSNSPTPTPAKSPPPSPRRPRTPGGSLRGPAPASRLREAYFATSPENSESAQVAQDDIPPISPLISENRPIVRPSNRNARGGIQEPSQREANVRTRLLEDYHKGAVCGSKSCSHGTFSPHIRAQDSISSVTSSIRGFDGQNTGDVDSGDDERPNPVRSILGSTISEGLFGPSKSDAPASQYLLSKTQRVRGKKKMYLGYYFPFTNWVRQYQWRWFRGDLAAAFTMASFYIPMSLSYASNLGHIPPINGIYSFVFNPLIYALFGTSPQMVVGPEAAGSLLIGTVVRDSVDRQDSNEDDSLLNAQIAGVATGMAGAVILIAGLTRLGFLDNVLSRPFLRGFISAIGFVIFVEQLIPELGLTDLANLGVSHGSSVDKMVFVAQHLGSAHRLTTAIAAISFVVIMVCRTIKRQLQPHYPGVAFVPDRFIIVVLSAVLAWALDWESKGVRILGNVNSTGGHLFTFHWPFSFKHMIHIRAAMSTSFLIALLGFFESSVAAKSLGDGTSELQGISLSPNRELVALGVANLVGGCFMALPAFGGYGRSKVNASTGGTTPMSSIFLSLITIFCIYFLLPYFFYLPKAVLSSMISVVAYSLIEECPHDIRFFWRIRGWTELFLMFIIFLATIFYSLSLGIALGIGLSVLSLIRHSTKPRIQILGKVPGSVDKFENAELDPERIEFIEGCLICKIPEPLTFANTGELKTRLRRLEQYGTNAAHPALPRLRAEEHNRNIIFDVHGVTSIDGSGTQVLTEIVEAYVKRGVRVFFCRLPTRRSRVYDQFLRSGIVDSVGGQRYFLQSVDEALRLSELESLTEYFDTRDGGDRATG